MWRITARASFGRSEEVKSPLGGHCDIQAVASEGFHFGPRWDLEWFILICHEDHEDPFNYPKVSKKGPVQISFFKLFLCKATCYTSMSRSSTCSLRRLRLCWHGSSRGSRWALATCVPGVATAAPGLKDAASILPSFTILLSDLVQKKDARLSSICSLKTKDSRHSKRTTFLVNLRFRILWISKKRIKQLYYFI